MLKDDKIYIYLYAIMFFTSFLHAIFACWPKCKIYHQANRHFLPPGLITFSAPRPAGIFCLKAFQRAEFAFQERAKSALLLRAKNARDSY
jgi:hypothetical protein